jgi:hypothetical protein
MSKDVAVISDSGEVVAINVHLDDYELAPNELLVTGIAWVGGDYVDGYFYPPQPFASWTRNQGNWTSLIPMPNDGDTYIWNENDQKWEPLDFQ